MIAAFRDTQMYVRLDGIEVTTKIMPALTDSESPAKQTFAITAPTSTVMDKMDKKDTEFYRWPLGKGASAELFISGMVRAAHFDLVKQYLDVVRSGLLISAESDAADES